MKTDALGAWQYSWDYENRLTQVTKPDGQTITYKYDALGRRIERSKGGLWTRFTYDGADVVLDRSSDGSTVEYTNGLGIDDKLSQRSNGGGALYFVADHLGGTRSLTDSAGNVVEQVNYDSFGDSAGSALTRYGYTGRERDADTELYYYRARWYDSQQGRFISEDPIGLAGGINWYAYVGNNSANLTDPSGLCPPQTGPDLRAIKEITTCQKFALEVQDLANGASDVTEFLDGLARTFLSVADSSYNEMLNANGNVLRGSAAEFISNSGIRQEFRGSTDEGAQIRHFVAGFIIVSQYGHIGSVRMNGREDGRTPASRADLAVNNLSAVLARRYTPPYLGGIGRIRRELVGEIRTRFCEF